MTPRSTYVPTPCYIVVIFDIEDVYTRLVDEATWRWMHHGGPVPETQTKAITELELADLEEVLEDCDEDGAVYERAHYVSGVFGPKISSAGRVDDMSVSAAIRYARENNLELVDAFTTECSI